MTEEIIIDGLNFCMSSVCPEKDCIYALVYKLHQKIDYLEQENKELLETLTKGCYQNLQHECRIWELKESKYRSALEEIKNIVENLSHCKIPHEHCFQEDCSDCILNEIKKVLNDSEC